MTQQMQNLQLSQTRKCPSGPASPSAAKRLYRNLSEKLRGSTSSFEDAYFFGKTDRLRKTSVSVSTVVTVCCASSCFTPGEACWSSSRLVVVKTGKSSCLL